MTVRLYDTATRVARRASRPRRQRSGCTSAARRSTSGPTSATPCRSSSSRGCATGCASAATTSRTSTTSPTSTTRSTRPRPARAPSGHGRRRAWYLEDTASFGLEMPDEQPLATETIPEIVALIEELVDVGPRLRVRRRRLLPGLELRDLRRALRAAARPGRGAGAERAEGGSARLRALEGDEGGRGHVLGVALGPRPAGLAHRVLGDGREDARAGVPDPRRRARPRLPAPRERARPVARRRPAVREDLDAQRAAAVRRREDVEVGRATSRRSRT